MHRLARIDGLEAATAHPDRRIRDFAERALERRETGRWLVLHCTNPRCGCDCRRYIRIT